MKSHGTSKVIPIFLLLHLLLNRKLIPMQPRTILKLYNPLQLITVLLVLQLKVHLELRIAIVRRFINQS